MKFKYNDLVKSRNTFFVGFFGKIKSFEMTPEGDVVYSVEGNFDKDERLKEMKFREKELKKVLFGRKW